MAKARSPGFKLFIAAALAAVLVILVGWGERLANRRMGVRA